MPHTTNAFDTFIAVAPDCAATCGTEPKDSLSPSIARRTFAMISVNPYRYTSDDVIFTVYADRQGIPESERAAARAVFFAKGQACLRASDLGKKYGWGVHADDKGRVALYGVETDEYKSLASGKMPGANGEPVTVTRAMRSARAR